MGLIDILAAAAGAAVLLAGLAILLSPRAAAKLAGKGKASRAIFGVVLTVVGAVFFAWLIGGRQQKNDDLQSIGSIDPFSVAKVSLQVTDDPDAAPARIESTRVKNIFFKTLAASYPLPSTAKPACSIGVEVVAFFHKAERRPFNLFVCIDAPDQAAYLAWYENGKPGAFFARSESFFTHIYPIAMMLKRGAFHASSAGLLNENRSVFHR